MISVLSHYGDQQQSIGFQQLRRDHWVLSFGVLVIKLAESTGVLVPGPSWGTSGYRFQLASWCPLLHCPSGFIQAKPAPLKILDILGLLGVEHCESRQFAPGKKRTGNSAWLSWHFWGLSLKVPSQVPISWTFPHHSSPSLSFFHQAVDVVLSPVFAG